MQWEAIPVFHWFVKLLTDVKGTADKNLVKSTESGKALDDRPWFSSPEFVLRTDDLLKKPPSLAAASSVPYFFHIIMASLGSMFSSSCFPDAESPTIVASDSHGSSISVISLLVEFLTE